MTTNCPTCHKPTDSLKTVIRQGQLLSGCDNCLISLQIGNPEAAKYRREMQKKDYRRELTQPNQGRDFIRAYGVDKAREHMNDETIRKLS